MNVRDILSDKGKNHASQLRLCFRERDDTSAQAKDGSGVLRQGVSEHALRPAFGHQFTANRGKRQVA